MIELATIGGEILAKIKNGLEFFLNLTNSDADANLTAQLLLQMWCSGNVIGMRMGLEDPIYYEIIPAHIFNNFSSGIWTQGDLSIIKDATYGFNQKEDVVATLHPLHWTTSVHLQNTTVALILTVLTVRR